MSINNIFQDTKRSVHEILDDDGHWHILVYPVRQLAENGSSAELHVRPKPEEPYASGSRLPPSLQDIWVKATVPAPDTTTPHLTESQIFAVPPRDVFPAAKWGQHKHHEMTFACTTSAAALSKVIVDRHGKRVANSILLEHKLLFIPGGPDLRSWDYFRVRVRPLKPEVVEKLLKEQQMPISEWLGPYLSKVAPKSLDLDPARETKPWLANIWDGIGDTWDPENPRGDGYTLIEQNAGIIDDAPASTPSLTSNSVSDSASTVIDANIGFMGDAAMGGISTSQSRTSSQSFSWSTPSVSVADVSRGKKYIDKKFIMHDTTGGDAALAQDPGRNPGAFKFSIDVAVIFEVPDDLRGVRPIDEEAYSELIDSEKAAFRYFELAVGAYRGDCGTEPGWDSEVMMKPDDKSAAYTYGPQANGWSPPERPNGDGTLAIAVAPMRRQIIKVLAPPLPKGWQGLDAPNRWNDLDRDSAGRKVF